MDILQVIPLFFLLIRISLTAIQALLVLPLLNRRTIYWLCYILFHIGRFHISLFAFAQNGHLRSNHLPPCVSVSRLSSVCINLYVGWVKLARLWEGQTFYSHHGLVLLWSALRLRANCPERTSTEDACRLTWLQLGHSSYKIALWKRTHHLHA